MEIRKQKSLKFLITIGVFSILTLFCGSNAFSAMSSSLPNSYGPASHHTTAWQQLETRSENSQDGVFWSIDGGTWGHTEELYVGQKVQFQFNVHKDNRGTHYADLLKAWVDWDNSGTFRDNNVNYTNGFQGFSNTEGLDETIMFNKEVLRETRNGAYIPTVKDFTYTSQVFDISSDHIGDLFLRARVTCSHSAIQDGATNPSPRVRGDDDWKAQWNGSWVSDQGGYASLFNPTGYYGQGELEEWKLTVAANPVPEPSTIILFGFGLLGLAGASRKQNKQ